MPPDDMTRATATGRIAIQLIDVSKVFGASGDRPTDRPTYAVDHMSLDIRAGEFFTFLGPSGCGKTTTLRMIAGFEAPTSGQLLLDGRDVTGVPAHLRNVNTVFQSYALFPHLDVGQNVGFGLSVKGVAKAEIRDRVMAALEGVRMAHAVGRKPSELSGGQQQRIALARALINRPSVLLLDEPFGALDLKLRREMQIEVKEMQRKLGITFIFVTHDQEEALTMSDRIAVMNNGLIQQVGDPVSINEEPANRFTAGFIGDMNMIEARVTGRDGNRLTLEAAGTAIALESDLPLAPGSTCMLAIRPEALSFSAPSGKSEIGFTGTAGSPIYIGSDSVVSLTLPGGQVLEARLRSRRAGLTLPNPGARAELSCPLSAIRILTQ